MLPNVLHKQLRNYAGLYRSFFFRSNSSSSQINIKKLEEESALSDTYSTSEENESKAQEIEKSRNKSRLREADRRILLNQNPYPNPKLWHHGTLKYLRKAYGRYGSASGVNPSICWPTKEELDDIKEWERVKYYYSVQEVVEETKQKRKEKEEKIWAQQREMQEKLKKLDQWKNDMYERIAKKEREAKAAKEKKERLIEEVRRHFGFTVDPKDDRFKVMLEQKEKEQKKAIKDARKKAKEAKYMEMIMGQHSGDQTNQKASEVKAENPKENKE